MAPSPRPSWLSRNVLALGLVSLLTDAASEMVLPLLPAFVTALGGGAMALGWIEGLADATAALLRLVAGRIADRTGRRKLLVLGGYGLSSAVRPLVALATAPAHVAAVRVLDRVGKGLRGSPRDALIAASVPPGERGRAFGFHRAMDHAGAVLGPLMAFALITLVTDDLRTLFWLAAIPGALAVVAVTVGVSEVAIPDAAPRAQRRRGPSLPAFLLPVGVFTLGRASDVFLLLLASGQRAALVELPLLWIGLHVVRMLAATPGGWLADRFGRVPVVAVAWVVHAAVYAVLATTDDLTVTRALLIAYGLTGLGEGAEKALVAEIAPSRQWGSAFGWFHFVVGIATLVASVGFGWLWEAHGRPTAFLASAIVAAVAVALLAAVAVAARRAPP